MDRHVPPRTDEDGDPVEDNGWGPFKLSEIDAFYRGRMKSDSGFTFNRLVEGTHAHVSASTNPPADKVCIDSYAGMIGYRHICKNEHCVLLEGEGDQTVIVTERFVERLVSSPDGFKAGRPSPGSAST